MRGLGLGGGRPQGTASPCPEALFPQLGRSLAGRCPPGPAGSLGGLRPHVAGTMSIRGLHGSLREPCRVPSGHPLKHPPFQPSGSDVAPELQFPAHMPRSPSSVKPFSRPLQCLCAFYMLWVDISAWPLPLVLPALNRLWPGNRASAQQSERF